MSESILLGVFWAVFLLWQAAPAIVLWPARATGALSTAGTAPAAALVCIGTGAAWYVAYNDSSSTAPAILLVSPALILGAELLVVGVDAGIRASARALRHG
jgi:hypothetical protein